MTAARAAGQAGASCRRSGGVASSTRATVDTGVALVKGCEPVASSNSSTPKAKMSARKSTGSPRICSGAM